MSMSELEVLAHIDRRMLYSFVWSIPPEVLAERMSVSVDAIQRSCANRGIPYPGTGYWMQVAAGMRPPRPPLTEHRPGPQGTTGTAEDAVESVFSQAWLSEKSAPFFRVSPRKFFGFRRGHAPSFLTCRA